MRWKELLEDEGNFDIEYYLQEGCGMFAHILSQMMGEGMIEIFSDPNGEAWNDEITFEVTHVAYKDLKGDLYDARGKRTLGQMINKDFPQGLVKKVTESPEEFSKGYMGESDEYPLYPPQPDDIEKINRYVRANPVKFGIQVNETSTAGATGAGSVATVVGGLGAGFDPNGEWRSIYPSKKGKNKKPLMIKRPPYGKT